MTTLRKTPFGHAMIAVPDMNYAEAMRIVASPTVATVARIRTDLVENDTVRLAWLATLAFQAAHRAPDDDLKNALNDAAEACLMKLERGD